MSALTPATLCPRSSVDFIFFVSLRADWFKAGKGPDPKVASLDRGLDSYWSKAAEKRNGAAAAGDDKMEDAAGAQAPAAVAPVTGVDPEL